MPPILTSCNTASRRKEESYFYAPAWTAEGLTMGTIPTAFRTTAERVGEYAGMHTPAYKTPAGLDATPEQVARWSSHSATPTMASSVFHSWS
jgi:hypothetical protein